MECIQAIAVIIAAVIAAIIPIAYREYAARTQQNTLAFGKQVAIRTCDGEYVMSDLNANGRLFGRARHVQQWETFEIVDALDPFSTVQKPIHYGDKVAFRAINNGSFVGAALDSQKELVARVLWVQAWETFTLLRPPNTPENPSFDEPMWEKLSITD